MNPAEFANIARLEDEFWWYRGMREILSAALKPLREDLAGKNVLEAGCGTGTMSRYMQEQYGCRMFPSDLSAVALSHSRDRGCERLMQADIRALPVADASFDAVLSLDVIVHLERGREGTALSEFHRVLRQRGLLILRVSALDVLRSRHSEFAHERQRFTRARLVRAMQQAGFSMLRITYANSILLPVALLKFRVWEPLMQCPPQSGISAVPGWLDQFLERVLRAEARWIARRDFPIGQSLIAIARKDE